MVNITLNLDPITFLRLQDSPVYIGQSAHCQLGCQVPGDKVSQERLKHVHTQLSRQEPPYHICVL